jgi:hypothetical protein
VKYGQASSSAPSAVKLNTAAGRIGKRGVLLNRLTWEYGTHEDSWNLKKGEEMIRYSTDIGK